MKHDIYNFKIKNLHQELVECIHDFSRDLTGENDLADLFQYINHLTKKHNYCSGGCPWAEANNIKLKQNGSKSNKKAGVRGL